MSDVTGSLCHVCHDHEAPIGNRLALRHPEKITGIWEDS